MYLKEDGGDVFLVAQLISNDEVKSLHLADLSFLALFETLNTVALWEAYLHKSDQNFVLGLLTHIRLSM